MSAVADLYPTRPDQNALRVLLIEDHWLVRYALRQMLVNEAAAVVSEVDYAAAASLSVAPGDWDLVLVSFVTPDRSILDLIRRLREESPETPVLAIGIHSEYHFTRRVISAGATAMFLRDSSPAEVVAAIARARDGGPPVARVPHITRPSADGRAPLSEREYQVLQHLATGGTVSEAAVSLGISVKTVSTYRTRLLDKLGLKTNAALMRFALDHGMVE